MWRSEARLCRSSTPELDGGRRLRRRRSEDFRGRREYGGDEVEAVELFLTGDDEVAAALGFEKLEQEREVERSKGSEEGEGDIYSHDEKLFARRFWTNVPLTLLIA